MRRTALAATVASLIVVIFPALASAAETGCAAAPAALGNFEALAPAPAPDVAFFDADDGERRFADHRGRGVVANFWATWCAPCIHEMPALDRLRPLVAGDGIDVLALSADFGGVRAVVPFLAKNGLANLEVLIDRRQKVAAALGVPGLPTTVLIDAEGRVVGRVVGIAEWDAPEAVAFVRACLAPPS